MNKYLKNHLLINKMDIQENTIEKQTSQEKEVRLVDILVNDENMALNLMVNFLSLAQKRGAFTIDESAKIWECIQKFKK